jgi:hypothetical protein
LDENGNERAAYELLKKINQNFNRVKLNTIQSSQGKDQYKPGWDMNEKMENLRNRKANFDDNNQLLDDVIIHDDDDDDETNTVIENECENDYTDIY